MVQDRIRGKLVAEGLQRGDAVGGASFSVGAESSNIINVGIQLQDEKGADIAFAGQCPYWLSSDSAGQVIASAPDGGIAIGTDGLLIEWTANVSGLVISETDGDIDIDVTSTSTSTWYLNLGLGNGKFVTSDAITFA
jgi:hypothetical protein